MSGVDRGFLTELLGRNPPRWILAIVTGPEQTDYIARRISKAGLPPEPTLIRGQFVELKPCAKKVLNPSIQVRTLEVHNDSSVTDRSVYRMQREGGVALWALKACVARWRVNNERKAHVAVERDRAIKVSDWKGNLVEIHEQL